MRALRKIIFVNSAHIRYAEVKLDGNVHFIGTQGVGKSTLLRAILFFYNADKLHLGIPKEMKTFDEFYLPHANSYIVYEVEHEHGPFSILTFRSSGRACYRFIDAAYSKDWLVDEHGDVTAEGKVIRSRIGGVYMSKIIDRYEQYRDILYGNRQALPKELARFQLMESNRYQNIPRSIQNVFLNSRLDANFIKDIIIRSMSEEEANIDLGYFRRQVADFEQEYKDISSWYKLNAKGESMVRKQADAVVTAYHELLYMKQQISELCDEMNYAVRTARERLPLVEKHIGELTEKREQQERLLDELQKKMEHERTVINKEQGVVDEKLSELKKRRDHYAQLQIEEILSRCNRQQVWKDELDALKMRLADLTTRYNDVTSKYKALRQGLENQLEQYRNTQEKCILQHRNEKQSKEERLLAEYNCRREEIDAAFEEKLTLSASAIKIVEEEQTKVEKSIVELKYWQPYKDELAATDKAINELLSHEKENKALAATVDSNIKQLQTEYERQEDAILAESKYLQETKKNEIETTESEIAKLTQLLERTKGSLYEWLEENKHDWEQNIGKVINEEKVLYQIGLHPKKTEGSSFFGVQLDLEDLSSSVRKPAELKAEKESLEHTLQMQKQNLVELTALQEKQVNDLKRQFSPKMKDLKQQKSVIEMELRMVPQKLNALKVKNGELIDKAKQEKEARQQELDGRRQNLLRQKTEAVTSHDKLKADKQKQFAQADKAYKTAKEEAESIYNQQKENISIEIKAQEKRINIEIQELQEKELAELKGRGADTALVDECNRAISKAEQELEYIDNNFTHVIEYRKDKKELFDHEEELKNNKRQLADKLLQLNEKYSQRSLKHKGQIALLNKELNEYSKEKERITDDLKKAENFAANENLCPPMLADGHERQTLRMPGQIVSELTGIIVSRQKRKDQFKQYVNLFKSNFSNKNTFNFRTDLTLDEDFFDFANNLDDFLVNNKIEEYRRRTSERYLDILARISKEMGDLTRHESDVDKIIHDINNDFRERNFAGVIKLIAIQSVPSTDKMVQLMKRIKEFNDENQFAMGEINLFSTANRDDLNQKAVGYLQDFMKSLLDNPQRQYLTLSDLFQLQFRIIENDNDTGWADKLSHVGSEGTDTLVKAMVNIMLINVFKEKVSRRFGDFRIHCMMDEIGKLHPQNVKGILDFANARNILLINSSPTTYNVSDYRYTYLLSKDGKSQTVVCPLISQK